MIQKDIILLTAYLALWIALFATQRRYLAKPVALATALAAIWSYAAQAEYGYNTPMIDGFGLNLFPLIGWALGLSAAFILFTELYRFFPVTKWWQKLLLLNVFYIPLLLLVETVAYHYLNVVNVATASFSGLPVCNCIHAPPWMQISYLAMGSVYLGILIIIRHDTPPIKPFIRKPRGIFFEK